MARSTSRIGLPSATGIFTSAGRYFCTGSSSLTSPRSTMSASSVAVKTFVTEPISYTVSGSGAVRVPLAVSP